ncbi:MAG: NeuD/PglB/VioB family sugar acetyltransferase [Pseudomonadota bacterium]
MKPVVLLGYGGHGRVVADLLRVCGRDILGYTGPERVQIPKGAEALEWLGPDDQLIRMFAVSEIELANGLGSIGDTTLRRTVFEQLAASGGVFPNLQHPSACVSPRATVERGAQIMAGAVVQTGAFIGPNVIINTRASIDHDCKIAAHVHVAPGCVLSGDVDIAEGAHLGTGCIVAQGVRIGAGAVVGAGATVLADVASGAFVAGTPAIPRPRGR